MAKKYTPPASVASAASRGLEYRKKASPSNKGGLTPEQAKKEGVGSGVQRAVNLKNRDSLDEATVRRMHSFFSRSEENKSVSPENKGKPYNDKGHTAWLLWGGDAGKAWAEGIVRGLDENTPAKRREGAARRAMKKHGYGK